MEEAKEEDVNIRFNSPGGDVFRGWGAVTKIKEHERAVNGIIDGLAASMAGVMLPYLDSVKATNVSFVMIHAASNNGDQDPGRVRVLRKVNEDILAAFRKKNVNETMFQMIAGVSLEDLFLNENFKDRDVWLTAEEANNIGLIDEVIDINSNEFQAFEKKFVAYNEKVLFLNQQSQNDDGKKEDPKPEKTEIMNKSELKEKHPEVYNAIIAEGEAAGEKKGVEKERVRVKAFVNFIDADSEGVVKAIKEGEEFNDAALSDLTQKALKTGVTAAAEEESPAEDDKGKGSPKAEEGGEEGKETKEEKDEAAKKVTDFLNEVDDNLGLKNSKN